MQEDFKIQDAAGELRRDRKYFSRIGMMFFGNHADYSGTGSCHFSGQLVETGMAGGQYDIAAGDFTSTVSAGNASDDFAYHPCKAPKSDQSKRMSAGQMAVAFSCPTQFYM